MAVIRRLGVAALGAWLVVAVTGGSALAIGGTVPPVPTTFGHGSATSKFGEFVDFKQPVTAQEAPQRVEVLVSTPGSIGPTVIPLADLPPAGESTMDYRVDLTDGHVVPNTTFTVRFRLIDPQGTATVGPPIRHTYADDRYDWKTLDGKVVRVHWTEGDQQFGQRALRIGDDAVGAAADILGVTETDPIDFFIYADQSAFYDALGPSTRENVGGQAHPDIRTLFALITPDELNASWVESVVPHELTHVVFATAVDNAYHEPPHWLNEGLAVYLSEGYADTYRSQVEIASQANSIIPLDGLAGAFPTTQERFFQAYAESVSAVDFIVKTSGRDALVKLIRSYHDGVSDDDAFRAALGKDVAAFQAAWLESLGAKAPDKTGPRPAPAGPLPAGWEGPQPNPSFEVVGSLPPAAAPAAPIGGKTGSDQQTIAAFVLYPVIVTAVLVLVLAIVSARRMRRRTEASALADGDNRLFGRPPASDHDGLADAGTSLWASTDWSLPKDPEPGGAGAIPTQPPFAPAPTEQPPTEQPPEDAGPPRTPEP